MILKQLKNLDIETVGDVEEGVEAGISKESLPFIFEMVSKQLYSDPIGTIVRELVSNCFDAHTEANKLDTPVIVNRGYDKDEGYYIEFIDKGIGMSPDRVQNIYMNYFSSSKRNSNKLIGSFGLGSKSPLAYTSMFYITTVYNKAKYDYIFHEGTSKPTLESLNGYRQELSRIDEETGEYIEDFKEIRLPVGLYTEEENGTTIKIVIEKDDLNKFETALKNQLIYFDNVYFKDWSVSNDYHIYEGKYFKFRSDIVSNSSYGKDIIHLCIGKVRYPIDFNKVKTDLKINYQSFPIAVKFEIGELSIIPSRENIRYDEETIAILNQRIKLAVNELMDLYNSQNPVIESLEEYQSLINDKPKITFNEEKGHCLYIKDDSIAKGFIFKPFQDLKIKTLKNFFLSWECIGYLRYGKRENHKYPETVDNSFILNCRCLIVDKQDRVSSYTDININQTLGGFIYFIRKKEIDYEDLSKKLGIKDSASLGKAKTIMSFLAITNNIVISRFKKYSDLRPTDKWIAEYKKELKEKSLAWIRRKNKEIVIKDVGNGSFETVKAISLQKRTGILVWGFKEEIKDLEKALAVGRCNPNWERRQILVKGKYKYKGNTNKAFKVIQIAKNIILDIQGAEKTIHVSGFFKTKIYKKILTAAYIQKQLFSLSLTNKSFRMSLLPNFETDYNNIKKLIDKHYNSSNNRGNIPYEEDITKLDASMLKEFEAFKAKNYDRHIPMLDAVHNLSDTDNLIDYTKYLIYKKVRIKNQFYLKQKPKDANN